jgi:hypothetical protein
MSSKAADNLGCETCRRRKVRCKRPESNRSGVDESSTSAADLPVTTPLGPEQRLAACLVSFVGREDHRIEADLQPCLAIGEECVTVYSRKRVSFSRLRFRGGSSRSEGTSCVGGKVGVYTQYYDVTH